MENTAQSILYLGSRQRWVVISALRPSYSWGNSLIYPFHWKVGGPQCRSRRCGEERKSPLSGIEFRYFQSSILYPSHYTDWAIQAPNWCHDRPIIILTDMTSHHFVTYVWNGTQNNQWPTSIFINGTQYLGLYVEPCCQVSLWDISLLRNNVNTKREIRIEFHRHERNDIMCQMLYYKASILDNNNDEKTNGHRNNTGTAFWMTTLVCHKT
jgi:hypothetical protein